MALQGEGRKGSRSSQLTPDPRLLEGFAHVPQGSLSWGPVSMAVGSVVIVLLSLS